MSTTTTTDQDHENGPENVEQADGTQDHTEAQNAPENGAEGAGEGDTFPRSYVERLRTENAGYRARAARADEFASALWEARVTASGRLADATDLPMPEGADPLDADAITAAVDELLARKPHLASRTPRGDVGQGATGSDAGMVDLAAILRAGAA